MKRLAVLIMFLICALGVPHKVLAQATLLPPGEQCFSALTPTSGGPNGTGTGFIGLLGPITGGAGGTSGTYTTALTGGNGSNATATVVVSGGTVTSVTIVNPGIGFAVGNVLTAASANIGGVTGFFVAVSSVSINQSLAGGTVAFYIPNTLTYKQTWFNADQSNLHQNSNPVQLDANGCAVIYGSGIYRQVLQDSLGNIVWDQLTASTNQNNPYWANLAGGTANAITVTDTAFAGIDGQIIGFIPIATNTGATTLNPSGFGTYSIVKDTATGAVALTGGEIVANSPSNVVYVSYSASQNNFHIINLVQSAASISPTQSPQGYLNLLGNANGGPVQIGDITAATAIYYSPDVGNQIPIWNGTSFTILAFPELTLNLSSSSQASNNIYDICIFNNSGSPVAVFGPAWSNSTAGAGARGTGSGTTQLTYQSGILVNAFSIAANNGSNTYTIPALECTYVGSAFIDGTAGQISNYRSWGQSRKFGLWNAYNRVPIVLQVGDTTASWAYATATIRPSNNLTANSLTEFTGLAQEQTSCNFSQKLSSEYPISIGIGWNSTTAYSGTSGSLASNNTGAGAITSITSAYQSPPSLGTNIVTSLEDGNASGTETFYGTQVNMLLSCTYRG